MTSVLVSLIVNLFSFVRRKRRQNDVSRLWVRTENILTHSYTHVHTTRLPEKTPFRFKYSALTRLDRFNQSRLPETITSNLRTIDRTIKKVKERFK